MSSDILKTWGEIAGVLRCSIKTAQRYAQEYDDFPLFRDGNVWSRQSLLESWLNKRIADSPNGKKPRKTKALKSKNIN